MIPSTIMLTTEAVKRWLEEKRGVLTAKSALIFRESYFGHGIIAPNTPTDSGSRGVPVELWIMSMVEADNPTPLPGEGLTKIKINEEEVTLRGLKEVAEETIFGKYAESWPLTKVLDIGGGGIPVHVHPKKTEAYFFPPTDLPPYNRKISATTKIGLKEKVSQENIKENLKAFGQSDSMYNLLNTFAIEPRTGWTVPEGVLHAPGPYLTFEIQRPQDDYHLSAWRFGERLEGQEREQKYQAEVLRGLKTEDEYVEKVLNWPLTTDQNLKKDYFHVPKLLDSGVWGKRHQIFFDSFYGEGWEILPGQTLSLEPKVVPQAGIVWSGRGEVNGNPISQSGLNEFLAVPHTPLSIKNIGSETLYIYSVEPIK